MKIAIRAILVCGLVIGGGGMVEVTDETILDVSGLILSPSTPLAGGPGCGACVWCSDDEDKVDTVPSPNPDYEPFNCALGTTCYQPTCGPEEEEEEERLAQGDVERIWNGIISGSTADILRLVAEFPKNVAINSSRGSVQLSQCYGLIANIPLSEQQLAGLQP